MGTLLKYLVEKYEGVYRLRAGRFPPWHPFKWPKMKAHRDIKGNIKAYYRHNAGHTGQT